MSGSSGFCRLDITPCLSLLDVLHNASRDAKVHSYSGRRRIDQQCRFDSCGNGVINLRGLSSSVVFRSGDGLKMIGIDTVRRPTQMVEDQAVWDRSESFFVHQAMCADYSAVARDVYVTQTIFTGIPKPAARLAVHCVGNDALPVSTAIVDMLAEDDAALPISTSGETRRLTTTTLAFAAGVWLWKVRLQAWSGLRPIVVTTKKSDWLPGDQSVLRSFCKRDGISASAQTHAGWVWGSIILGHCGRLLRRLNACRAPGCRKHRRGVLHPSIIPKIPMNPAFSMREAA